jgi:hypothetical protein
MCIRRCRGNSWRGGSAHLSVDLDLRAEDHARLLQGAGMPDGALSVVLRCHASALSCPSPDLPPLVDGIVSGKGQGERCSSQIAKAAADLGNGRQLMLSEGSFSIAETWVQRAPARVASARRDRWRR